MFCHRVAIESALKPLHFLIYRHVCVCVIWVFAVSMEIVYHNELCAFNGPLNGSVCQDGIQPFHQRTNSNQSTSLTAAESDSLILPYFDSMSGFRVCFDPNGLQGFRV